MMAVQRSTQPESKLPRATTSTSSLSTARELAKSNGYSSKHTIQQTNNVEKVLQTITRSAGSNNNNKVERDGNKTQNAPNLQIIYSNSPRSRQASSTDESLFYSRKKEEDDDDDDEKKIQVQV
jgi:hypothetical protein